MARGKSGKILVEVDPEFKEDLYVTVKNAGLTMKEWVELQGQITIEKGSAGLAKLVNERKKQ